MNKKLIFMFSFLAFLVTSVTFATPSKIKGNVCDNNTQQIAIDVSTDVTAVPFDDLVQQGFVNNTILNEGNLTKENFNDVVPAMLCQQPSSNVIVVNKAAATDKTADAPIDPGLAISASYNFSDIKGSESNNEQQAAGVSNNQASGVNVDVISLE